MSRRLLSWYGRHGRDLPWRTRAPEVPDPYRVWLSEIMLQQTQVATVIPYFQAFTGRWPALADLASADQDAVLQAWVGLGYYSRGRNLLKCARVVCDEHGGRFPDQEAALLKLPGIGPYTAAAISAIAFGIPAAAIDGNVIRVISRLYAFDKTLPGLKKDVEAALRPLIPARRRNTRNGDFAQALMDLGATVCTPRDPACADCPWEAACAAHAAGSQEAYPTKAAKKPKPTRLGVAFWAMLADGRVLVRKRPDRGLLGGMMEFPSTPWRESPWATDEALEVAPVKAAWKPMPGVVRHVFTHFNLELTVMTGSVNGIGGNKNKAPEGGIWCPRDGLGGLALPIVMKKVAALALGHAPGHMDNNA